MSRDPRELHQRRLGYEAERARRIILGHEGTEAALNAANEAARAGLEPQEQVIEAIRAYLSAEASRSGRLNPLQLTEAE